MTKAFKCLLAWSVSFKRFFIWLQIPAYLYYKHAAKTGTGCELLMVQIGTQINLLKKQSSTHWPWTQQAKT